MTDREAATELEDYDDYRETDVLVVGSGIAGLAAALGAVREGSDVLVATKATRPEGASSWWAQGGIAVARDDPEQFKTDILAASAGTADPEAVDVLVDEANDAVRDVLLEALGVEFDTVGGGSDGSDGGGESGGSDRSGGSGGSDRSGGGGANGRDWDFGREAAHDEARILHVDASTGKHIHVPFLNYLADRDGVTIRDDTAALDLITHEGRVHGALLERDGEVTPTFGGATVLATGGIGDLYPRSTNPVGSTGDGIAMAALAGADVADMEYVQFHPTVYAPPDAASDDADADADGSPDRDADTGSPGRDADTGSPDRDADTGSPGRDADTGSGDAEPFLVSEAVRGEGAVLRNGAGNRFMPDYHADAELAPRDVVARAVGREREETGEVALDVSPLDFAAEFPDLVEKCEDRGVDWASGIPVGPAEHFLCGGVDVDDRGRASLDRLYAVGESARTGVHGANRLASTSLLEGLVWGLRAGEDAAGRESEVVAAPELLNRDPALPDAFAREKFVRLRRVMDEQIGLRRSPADLGRAQAVLRRLKGEVDAYVRTRTSRSLYELRHASVTALLVARAAAENGESVGTHNLIEEPASSGAD